MGGHATHDEREARETFPASLFEEWGRRDPIGQYEGYLVGLGWTEADLTEVEDEVTGEVERAAEAAAHSRDAMPAGASALGRVYAG